MGPRANVSAARPSSPPGPAQGCHASADQNLRTQPDRLVRVLAEGLLAMEKRRAASQTESSNRAIMALPKSEVPSDEPAREH